MIDYSTWKSKTKKFTVFWIQNKYQNLIFYDVWQMIDISTWLLFMSDKKW